MQTIIFQKSSAETKVVTFVVFWGLVSFLLGYFKFFTLLPRPLFGAAVILIQTSLIVVYLTNKNVKAFADGVPLKAIALFHVWRIFAGWIFISYSGILSQTFINDAAYGDIIAGCSSIGRFLFGHTKLNYYIFNIIGLLDFIIAVGTGITLTILADPNMKPLVELPLIMIPLFGVPLSGITHFISLMRLSKMKAKKLTDVVE